MPWGWVSYSSLDLEGHFMLEFNKKEALLLRGGVPGALLSSAPVLLVLTLLPQGPFLFLADSQERNYATQQGHICLELLFIN